MKKQISLAVIAMITLFSSCKKEAAPDTAIKDADGNIYTEIKIGTQTWLLENLNTTRFRNGDLIPVITDSAQWNNRTAAAVCDYDNIAEYGNSEGRLYNWYAAVDERNICPVGYHIPSAEELNTLVNFLGGSAIAGDKLKNTGTVYWSAPNTGATNQSGFTANAIGIRHAGNFIHRLLLGCYWATTMNPNPTMSNYAYYLHLQNGTSTADVSPFFEKQMGLAIRCIKD